MTTRLAIGSSTRRDFCKAAATAGLLAGSILRPARAKGASERITLGLIGCGQQGRRDLMAALHAGQGSVHCKTLSDPDDNQTALAMRELDDAGQSRGRQRVKEYRELLDDPEIDAVLIATPDHWHALAAADAIDAGKDVYLAAPVTAKFGEMAPVLERAGASNQVVQLGLTNRSLSQAPELRRIVAQELGTLASVRAWSFVPDAQPLVPEAPSTPPAYCDYEMWLGPAPASEFTMNRFHGSHYWYWDYGGGHLTRRGVYWLDLVSQLLDLRMPNRTYSAGGKHRFPADERETPDTQTAHWSFDDVEMSWRHALGVDPSGYEFQEGIALEGSRATLLIHESGWSLREQGDEVAGGALPDEDSRRNDHLLNFLDCLRSRQRPSANIATAYRSTVWCQLANASLRAGQPVDWDASSASPVRSAELDEYLNPSYRAPWRLPV